MEGEKRVRDYFKTNYIDENDKVERSEKEVYLGRVASTVQQISREKNQRIKQQTSIDWKELKKQFTIDELIAEINEIRNDANNSVEVTPLPRRGSGGLGHEDYAKLLAKYRKHLFAKDVTIKERLIGSINQNYECSEATSEEELASILSDKLFSLSQNVIDKARYNESMAPWRDHDVDL